MLFALFAVALVDALSGATASEAAYALAPGVLGVLLAGGMRLAGRWAWLSVYAVQVWVLVQAVEHTRGGVWWGPVQLVLPLLVVALLSLPRARAWFGLERGRRAGRVPVSVARMFRLRALERGQTSSEYIGMVVVVVAVIGALVGAGVSTEVGQSVGNKICQVFGGDCGESGGGGDDQPAADESDDGDDGGQQPAGDTGGTTQAEKDYQRALEELQEAQEAEKESTDKAKEAAKELAKILAEELGITDALDCITKGDGAACTETLINVLTSLIGGAVGKLAAKYGAPWKWKKAVELVKKVKKHGGDLYDGIKGMIKNKKKVKEAQEKVDDLKKNLPKKEPVKAEKPESVKKAVTCRAGAHSFLAGTPVVMADGSRKAIEDVRIGERVLVTDATGGLTVGAGVAGTITTEDDKDFVRLTVREGGRRSVITTTDTHPFWITGARKWVKAGEIHAGMGLRAPDGEALRVLETDQYEKRQRTYDLTIRGIHTYYVGVGDSAALVHNNNNCNKVTRQQSDDIASYLGYKKTNKKSATGAPVWENKKGKPKYITWDRNGHKGGIFKGASKPEDLRSTGKQLRDGTYDLDVDTNGNVYGLKWIDD